jgi:chromosome segregation ATPase
MTLQTQMEAISHQLLTGQISQSEALSKQRAILGQPDPLPAPETATINLSVESKVDTALAKIDAQKADISAQLQTLKTKAIELNAEREKLAGAIATSEQRLSILSGSPTQYRDAKAEAVAKSLLDGTPLDLAAYDNENADLADRLPATDLKAALRVLKTQLQEIERRKVGLTAETRKLSGDYFELHARAHGIRFAKLAIELVDEYAAVMAAHRANLSLGGFSQLAPDVFSNIEIHSPLPIEVCREIGITRQHWSGAIIEGTTAIRNAQTSLMAEMGV